MRDYLLHQLSTQDFEELVIQICQKILGVGTLNFSEGKDGGRDGKFQGTSNCFPSTTNPWNGKFIIQAKRTTNPVASCSTADFKAIIDGEMPKLTKLKAANELDHYLIFTNRKLTGDAHKQLTDYTKGKVGISNVEIFGVEKITSWLNGNSDIVKACSLDKFREPLRIYANDLKEVIEAFHKSREQIKSAFDSRYSFDYLEIDKKNELNKLSAEYFRYIRENSESHFNEIDEFLKKPINKKYTDYYYNTVNELQSKIITRRKEFAAFEEIFVHLFDFMLDKFPDLKDKRPLINVFLHYMYCSCEIGEKNVNAN